MCKHCASVMWGHTKDGLPRGGCRPAIYVSTPWHRRLHARRHVRADNRFMYLCTVAARLKGTWLHGVRGERGRGRGLFVRQTETDGVLGVGWGGGGEGWLIGDSRDWERGRGGIWRTRMLNHKWVLVLICQDGGPIRW